MTGPLRIAKRWGRIALCFAGLGAEVGAFAQDLNREVAPNWIFESRHLGGIGPVLIDCAPTEKGALKCRADRKLKAVECQVATRVGRGDSLALRGKVAAEQFLCERPAENAEESFGTVYKVSLLGAEGAFSEYAVSFAVKEQVATLYKTEMAYYSQRKAWYDRAQLGLVYLMSSVNGSSTLKVLRANAEALPGLWLEMSFAKASNGAQALGQDWRAGLRWEFFPRTRSYIPYAGFRTGQLTRLGRRSSLGELQLGLRADIFGRWLATDSRISVLYPRVTGLRNGFHAIQDFQFGPFFGRRVSFSAEAGWISELWSTGLAGSAQWKAQGLYFGSALAVNFGASR